MILQIISSSQANVIIMNYTSRKGKTTAATMAAAAAATTKKLMENRTAELERMMQKHSVPCSSDDRERDRGWEAHTEKKMRKKQIVETSSAQCNSFLSCSTLLFICSTLHKLFSVLEFCSIASPFIPFIHIFFPYYFSFVARRFVSVRDCVCASERWYVARNGRMLPHFNNKLFFFLLSGDGILSLYRLNSGASACAPNHPSARSFFFSKSWCVWLYFIRKS